MVAQSKTLVIINNAAAKAQNAWPVVRRHLEASALAFDFYETTGPGDATIRARAALRAGVNTIAVVGGDGTLSEVAQGFFEIGRASCRERV